MGLHRGHLWHTGMHNSIFCTCRERERELYIYMYIYCCVHPHREAPPTGINPVPRSAANSAVVGETRPRECYFRLRG